MKNWTSNSRYLYFIEKEKEKDEKRKETKLKDITLKDSIIPDKYEKILLKYDFISDKTKMDNLILDVLNNSRIKKSKNIIDSIICIILH